MSERVQIPAELHGKATHPALPGTPAVLYSGERQKLAGGPRERCYELVPPVGGHVLLDLYFCALVANFYGSVGPSDSDAELDAVTRFAWRLAISAVRTRPDTGPVPAGLPKALE